MDIGPSARFKDSRKELALIHAVSTFSVLLMEAIEFDLLVRYFSRIFFWSHLQRMS
jgi:hypothetical protein